MITSSNSICHLMYNQSNIITPIKSSLNEDEGGRVKEALEIGPYFPPSVGGHCKKTDKAGGVKYAKGISYCVSYFILRGFC